MTFDSPEVIELGLAEDLIQDTPGLPNTEGTMPARVKHNEAIYLADAE